jgi:hypothetical protein
MRKVIQSVGILLHSGIRPLASHRATIYQTSVIFCFNPTTAQFLILPVPLILLAHLGRHSGREKAELPLNASLQQINCAIAKLRETPAF